LAEQVEKALAGGATCVQLREKDMGAAALAAEARLLKPVCDKYGAPLIINDDIDVALAIDADGVHVGQGDMPVREARRRIGRRRILGVSVGNVEEALAASAGGADYLGVGAVFPTVTKPDAKAVSLEALAMICAAVDIPVVAIGGIRAARLAELAGTGIAGVAMASAIFAQQDIAASCREIRALCDRMFHCSNTSKGLCG
jgi:thiamine-phosphate pyrophosphorylase